MGIISKIKQSISKRIKFHKRLMFIGSLYGCIMDKNKDEFVNKAINEIHKHVPMLNMRACEAIKKEINYRIAKEIPINIHILMDTSCYKTKLSETDEAHLKTCFKKYPIPTEVSEKIEREYVASISCKPDIVQKELVCLVHGMNINVGSSAVKLPLFLQHFLWNNKSINMLVGHNANNVDIDLVVDKIIKLSPTNLWYGSDENMKDDIRKIITYIRDRL